MDIVPLTGRAAIYTNTPFNYVELYTDLNLTGFEGIGTLKRDPRDITEVGSPFLIVIPPEKPGVVIPTLSLAQVNALTPGRYWWDCLLRSPPGQYFLLCRGEVSVYRGVTRNVSS